MELCVLLLFKKLKTGTFGLKTFTAGYVLVLDKYSHLFFHVNFYFEQISRCNIIATVKTYKITAR